MKVVRLFVWLLLLAYWVFAAYVTHRAMPKEIGPLLGDKWAHYLGFGLLSGLLYLAIWSVRPTWRWTALVTFLVAVIYGCIDEITQPPFGRTADLLDWGADIAGALTATGCLGMAQWVLNRWLTAEPMPQPGALAAEN